MTKKKTNLLITLLIIFLLLFTIIFALLYVQPSLFFYPWHDNSAYNILLQNKTFEEIKIKNDENLLHGWVKYNTDNVSAPLVIIFGGNAQNSSNTCLNLLKRDFYKYFNNYNIMIIDYPGYGLSNGKPSEKTMFKAGLDIYDYAITQKYVDKENIIILGYSIGTGVANYVAANRDISGLILLAPYDRALSLYNNTLNIFHGPLELLAKYKFDSISYAPKIKVAPLIIASFGDEVINYNLALNLTSHFNKVNDLILLEKNIKHNDFWTQEIVFENINKYLTK